MVVHRCIYFTVFRNKPFRDELVGIDAVNIFVSEKSPDVAENHSSLGDKMSVIVVVLPGYMRYPKGSDGTPAEDLAHNSIHVRDFAKVIKGR